MFSCEVNMTLTPEPEKDATRTESAPTLLMMQNPSRNASRQSEGTVQAQASEQRGSHS